MYKLYEKYVHDIVHKMIGYIGMVGHFWTVSFTGGLALSLLILILASNISFYLASLLLFMNYYVGCKSHDATKIS